MPASPDERGARRRRKRLTRRQSATIWISALNGMDQAELAAIAGPVDCQGPSTATGRQQYQDAGKIPCNAAPRPGARSGPNDPSARARQGDGSQPGGRVARRLQRRPARCARRTAGILAQEPPRGPVGRDHNRASRLWPSAIRTASSRRLRDWSSSWRNLRSRHSPSGTRANSRQRAEAARLIPLWLVARACGKQAAPTDEADGQRTCRASPSRPPGARASRTGCWRCSASKVNWRSNIMTARRRSCLEPDAQYGRDSGSHQEPTTGQCAHRESGPLAARVRLPHPVGARNCAKAK